MVKVPGSTSFVSIKCMDGFLDSSPVSQWPQVSGAKWISPSINSSNQAEKVAMGSYQYRMIFNTNCGSISSAVMTLEKMGADNMVNKIQLNGTDIGFYNATSTTMVTNQSVNIPVTVGSNTLIVFTTNNPWQGTSNQPTWTGLLLKGFITLVYNNTPVPSFNANANYCAGLPLQFIGSAIPASVTNHYWEMAECDVNSNIVSGGYSYSQWVSGNPGSYTFPTPPCNKYYRIKLAIQNNCLVWKETTKVIYYSCGPTTNAGADLNLCSGSCGTIGSVPSMQDLVTSTWSWSNGVTTPQQSVCSPGIYTLTQTETATGCAKSDQVLVSVFQNDPDFIRNTHANPMDNFYTVDCTPMSLNANTVPGFGHVWSVEEVIQTSINPNTYTGVSGTNSGQGINPNPCCWWPLAINYFGGYTGVANVNCTGSCISTPNVGQFPLGKLYRITRGTWNTYCPWNQISYVVSQSGPHRTVNGFTEGFIWTEDKNAPDVSYLKHKSIIRSMDSDYFQNIKVQPNPTTDKVIVESNENIKSISVMTLNGVLILENQKQKEVSLVGLPSGMYFLDIVTDNARKTIKVVKE